MKGYFRKRGDKWSFTIDIGKDPITNKRQQKSKSGFKTKKEAQAACAEMINEIEKGSYKKPESITLGQFMREFIDNQIKPNFRPGTTYNYEATLEKYAQSIMGYKLTELSPLHIQKLHSEMLDNGYSPGTVKLVNNCLKRTISTAFEWGIISKNPALVKSPKSTKKSDVVWNLEQCTNFLQKAKGNTSYYLIYLLTIFTGLRRGEVLGISYDDIDFELNRIKINKQVTTVGGKSQLTDKLKSISSYRVLDVPSDIMKEIKDHCHNQKKLHLRLGIENKHNLVFCTSRGTWIHPNNINKDFRLISEQLKMEKITFHGLRHSHATILAEMKENVHAISSRLGHSSPTITNEVYVHLTEKMQQNLSINLTNLYKENIK